MTTWVKVLNSMPQHPKILKAGDRAAWVYVCGLCYSNEHLTDGFISRHALPVVAPGVRKPETLVHKLVSVGLWQEVEDGWLIHDYGEHQRSAEKIREQRTKDAVRKAAGRVSARTPNGFHPESSQSPNVEKCSEELTPQHQHPSSSALDAGLRHVR